MESNDIQEQTILFLARVMAIRNSATDTQFVKFMDALDRDAHDVVQMFLDEIRDFPIRCLSSECNGPPCRQSAESRGGGGN
jgi:hypothetical protein